MLRKNNKSDNDIETNKNNLFQMYKDLINDPYYYIIESDNMNKIDQKIRISNKKSYYQNNIHTNGYNYNFNNNNITSNNQNNSFSTFSTPRIV